MICDKIISDKDCNTIIQEEEFNPEYVYIYILQLNKFDGNKVSQVILRTDPSIELKFTIGQDGYYTLCKLEVPIDTSMPYHYKDGKFTYRGLREATLEELVNLNPEVSKLKITYYQYFQLCNLRKCYVEAASKVLNERTSIQCNNTGVNQEDIYKRDLLLSAFNVISYLAEMEQYEEAQRLLERISGCNGLCKSSNKCNCGCGV